MLLNARYDSDLLWEISDDPIIWRLDLGLETPPFPLSHQGFFSALERGVKLFASKAENAKGVILYDGPISEDLDEVSALAEFFTPSLSSTRSSPLRVLQNGVLANQTRASA